MNDNKEKTTSPKKQNFKKYPQLQRLKLEQLDGVAGGPAGDGCPWCIFHY